MNQRLINRRNKSSNDNIEFNNFVNGIVYVTMKYNIVQCDK